jgi:glycosyltransferase involved in cell wall biosynthesis
VIRLLHFLPVYAPAWQFGGPVLSVSRLCEGLAAEGAEVRVITTTAGLPDWPAARTGVPLNQGGVTVNYFPVDRQGGAIRSQALEQALPELLEGMDLLHLSAIWQPLGIPVQRAALERGLPVLSSLRGALGPYSLRHGWWKKLPYLLLRERPLLQRASGLHVTSAQEAAELDRLGRLGLGLRAPRFLLPNPLDLDHLRPDAAEGLRWRREQGLDPDRPLLLVCGRLHHKKGLDLLPPALAPLAHRPWQLVVVGRDGDGSGPRLRRAFARAGLAPRVHWLDTVAAGELAGVYNAADLLLLPSRHENFGNVVVEALACGARVLISDRTGVAGDLRDCPFATVLPRRTADWSATLAAWLERPERGGAEAAQWAAAHYGQRMVARRAMEIYAEILQTRPDRPRRP